MTDNRIPPVLAGLVVGAGLIGVLSLLSSSQGGPSPNIIGSPYSDQQTAVRIALANDTIQALFEGKEIEQRGVRPIGGVTSNYLMLLLQKDDNEKHLAVIVDTTNRRVVNIRPSIGWLSDDYSILRIVENGKYRAEFSFDEPLSKQEFSMLSSTFGITIEYYEYTATKEIAGGAQLFSDIYQLENDLKARHDAEIIGVNKILAIGKSMDLLKFIETNRDNISESKFVQVLG